MTTTNTKPRLLRTTQQPQGLLLVRRKKIQMTTHTIESHNIPIVQSSRTIYPQVSQAYDMYDIPNNFQLHNRLNMRKATTY